MDSKPKYFLYARKSTEDDDRQIMSIEAQLYELREFARKENLKILTEFQESKSAKTPGRPVFNEMMEKIEATENIGILAWHPDRLARNSLDGGKIIYLVDTHKILSLRFPTFWFESTPQGLFMLQVAFGQSKYYSDNLGENIKRGIRQKLHRGEWLNLAPFGYQNNPLKHNIEPHETNARVVKLAYEEYAGGGHSYISLAQYLADFNVTSKTGTPLAKASIKRLLTHRAYLGLVKHKGEWFDGSFEPIVSPQLFEAVQKVLQTRKRPRKRKVKHDFPFTGLFRCTECNSMFSAQWATGKSGNRYRYYRCSKKRGRCSQPYVQEKDLAHQLKARLQTISLCERYTDWMTKQVDGWERKERTISQSEVHHLSDKVKASEVRMEKLISVYLDGDIQKELYLKQKDGIMRTTLAFREKLKDVERGRNNWVEPLRQWIFDTKQADILAKGDNLHGIKSFIERIGTNPVIVAKFAHFSLPAPSDFVAKRQGILSSVSLAPHGGAALTRDEVSTCGNGGIRTHEGR
ncbi:recombinase family protein [bacterium]|nr:recombinase family protein [bacterium]